MGSSLKRPEGREIHRKGRTHQLVDTLWALQVLEAVLAKSLERHVAQQVLADHHRGYL